MLAWFIITLAVVVRVVSHISEFAIFPPNFAPIGALALFSGYYLRDSRAWFVPLVALVLSDMAIGFYNGVEMASVYISFAVIVWLGRLLRRQPGLVAGSAVTLGSSLLFFVVTNFAVWVRPGSVYAPTLDGLLSSYIAGIPFFKYTLAGDAVFTALFFGAYVLAHRLVENRHALRVKPSA